MGGAYTVPKRLGISRFALCLLSLVTLVAVGCGSGQGGSSGDVRFPSRDLTYLIPYDPGGLRTGKRVANNRCLKNTWGVV